ncbi:MAG: CopG family transcriptional regulator [Candidatus Dormibacteraeota bacterium]|nr:CopG family transcriptional regulator [Candidatus Dormibacteraeota bacterium]
MKRTTVSLPDEVAEAVGRAARRRQVSVSELTRRALTEYLRLAGSAPRPLPFANLGSSGYSTTAEDMEEILSDEWVRDRRS